MRRHKSIWVGGLRWRKNLSFFSSWTYSIWCWQFNFLQVLDKTLHMSVLLSSLDCIYKAYDVLIKDSLYPFLWNLCIHWLHLNGVNSDLLSLWWTLIGTFIFRWWNSVHTTNNSQSKVGSLCPEFAASLEFFIASVGLELWTHRLEWTTIWELVQEGGDDSTESLLKQKQ